MSPVDESNQENQHPGLEQAGPGSGASDASRQQGLTSMPPGHVASGATPKPRNLLRDLLREHCYEFFKDIVGPIRVILEAFVIFTVFLISDLIIIELIVWSAKDIMESIPVVSLIILGLKFFSLSGTAIYFAADVIHNYRRQRRIIDNIEKSADHHA